MISVLAQCLKPSNPELYTRHCFCRIFATLVADAGADLVTLKHLCGWRSTSVTKEYIECSVEQKKKIARLIIEKGEMCQLTYLDTTEDLTFLNITHS